MKTILVAGGAGFIGTHLIKKILQEDNHVTCLDNLSSGQQQNIKQFKDNPKFKFINHDINQPIQLTNITEIYNLACLASPKYYQEKPIETLEVSSTGVKNLINLAEKNNAILLQASTSEIYGDPNEHPQKEEYWGNVNPIGLRACYNEGKRFAEAMISTYNRKTQRKHKISRIFNTYGPNMRTDDGRVIPNFIKQAKEDQDITIYGDGEQTRSFCYVEDTVDALIKQMNSNIIEPINIGNPEEITIQNLAQTIIELTKSQSKIIYKPLPEDDPRRRKPNITQAKTQLGWKPTTNLKEGLIKTINWYEKTQE